jgi:glutamine amidotransferase
MTIGILDTGLGNLGSIQRMIEKVGGRAIYVSSPGQFEAVSKIILPGVGHFDEGMRTLNASGLLQSLRKHVNEDDLPILGICLGMQLLCRGSEEGNQTGLSMIDAEVQKFRFSSEQNLKVPHMGWNVVRSRRQKPLIPRTDEEQRFYFVHSYHVVPDDPEIIIGTASYGGEFCVAFNKGNIFGVQFHPEKSHRFGIALMKRFVDL